MSYRGLDGLRTYVDMDLQSKIENETCITHTAMTKMNLVETAEPYRMTRAQGIG